MLMTLTKDIRLAFDPALIGERVGLVLDDWQARLLREQPKRAMLLCSRQSGKSTVTGLLGLHTALYTPNALVVIVSPSQRQSAEMLRTVLNFYRVFDGVPAITNESVLRLEFANGSRILALPGSEKTVRGLAAVSMAIMDEAARCDDELFTAIRPMLGTSDGSLIMLATPAGKRGEFFKTWTEGENWHRVHVPASECPRLSPEFLRAEMKALGPMLYSQEYELQFCDDAECVFSSAIIDAAFSDPSVRPLWQ